MVGTIIAQLKLQQKEFSSFVYQTYFSSSSTNVSVEPHIKASKLTRSKYFRPDALHTTETQKFVSSCNTRYTVMKGIYIKFLSLRFYRKCVF
jgi:hypothetical protein